MNELRILTVVIYATQLLLVVFQVHPVDAAEDRYKHIRYNLYNLPTSKRAMEQLAAEVSFYWENKPLRDAVRDLGQANSLTIWLDRRIDPGQQITVTMGPRDNDRSLRAALRKIATVIQAEVALIENVVYFGPRGTPRLLQRAAVELHNAISQQANGEQAQMRGLEWGELTTPEELLAKISQQWKVQVEGELPHDLKHAGQLAGPCTLATQLTVVCGGFQREIESLGEKKFLLTELKQHDRWQTSYPRQALNATAVARAELNRLLKEYPGSSFRQTADQYEVLGTTDFHLALLRPKVRKSREADIDQQLWTFEVKNNSAQQVTQFFSNRLGIDITWDESCSPNDRQQLISFKVKDADIDALLDAFAVASQLKVRREKRAVKIFR